jgi:hypothetical protein
MSALQLFCRSRFGLHVGVGFFFASLAGLLLIRVFLAFPCFVSGLLVLPLCGAALTFFAAAKKVSKESGSNR